jgi:hypothetical protein
MARAEHVACRSVIRSFGRVVEVERADRACGRKHADRSAASAHPVGGPEVLSYVSDDLRVCGMVHGLDAYDLRRERLVVLLRVLDELELRRRRAHHEDLGETIERLRHIAKEVVRVVGVAL